MPQNTLLAGQLGEGGGALALCATPIDSPLDTKTERNIDRDRDTGRQRDRDTGRQRDRDTGRQRDRDTRETARQRENERLEGVYKHPTTRCVPKYDILFNHWSVMYSDIKGLG